MRPRFAGWLAPLLAGLLLGGCRGPVAAGPGTDRPAGAALAIASPEPGCAAGDDGVITEEDLGLVLAYTAPELPRELEALAAFVAARVGQVTVTLEAAGDGVWSAERLGARGCRSLAAERAVVHPQGQRLSVVLRNAAAAERRAVAEDHLRAGRFPEARAALQEAAAHDPVALPDNLLVIGESYLAEERFEEARSLFEELVRRWPSSARGWAGLATARRRLDRRLDAVDAATRAAALAPDSVARIPWLRGDPFVELRPALLPPAVRGSSGTEPTWRLMGGPGAGSAEDPQVRAEAVAYATCREGFRGSAELRAAAAGRPLPEWRWTPAEESVCTLMWLRAYLAHRGQGRAVVDGLEEVTEIAQRGLLDERALYDLVLAEDARVVLLLPEARRAQLLAFVTHHRVVPRKDGGWLFP